MTEFKTKSFDPSSFIKWLPALLLLAHFILSITSSIHKSFSYDEPNNLYYGYQFLTTGPGYAPDGQRTPIFAMHAASCLPFHCDSKTLAKDGLLRLCVRLPSIVFSLLTGLMLFLWTRKAFGQHASIFCLFLYCLNPNILAHSKQITSDISTCFFMLLATFLFSKWLEKKSWFHLVLISLSVAGCIISKYSGILLFPVFLILWFIHTWQKGRWQQLKNTLKKDTPAAFLLIVLSMFWINIAYGFSGSINPGSDYTWQSQTFKKNLGNFPFPLMMPKVFMQGMDYTKYISENPAIGRGNNYILGKRHRKGRWYAFPIMFLFKTPLAFFVFLLLGSLNKPKTGVTRIFWIPFTFWLFVFSLSCDVQIGIRYILPGLVFLFPIAGNALSWNHPNKKLILGFLSAWYAVSTLSYHPFYMSYFNEFIGKRIHAYKYLADSNLEWEDADYEIQKYKDAHPNLNLIKAPETPQAGNFILGANKYVGVMDEEKYRWLRERYQPADMIAYSQFIFHVSKDSLNLSDNPKEST